MDSRASSCVHDFCLKTRSFPSVPMRRPSTHTLARVERLKLCGACAQRARTSRSRRGGKQLASKRTSLRRWMLHSLPRNDNQLLPRAAYAYNRRPAGACLSLGPEGRDNRSQMPAALTSSLLHRPGRRSRHVLEEKHQQRYRKCSRGRLRKNKQNRRTLPWILSNPGTTMPRMLYKSRV